MFRQAVLFMLFGVLFQASGFGQALTSEAEEPLTLREQVEAMRGIYPAGVIAFEAVFAETFGAMGFTIDNPPTRELLKAAGWTDERINAVRQEFGELFFPAGMEFPWREGAEVTTFSGVTAFSGEACTGDSIPGILQDATQLCAVGLAQSYAADGAADCTPCPRE